MSEFRSRKHAQACGKSSRLIGRSLPFGYGTTQREVQMSTKHPRDAEGLKEVIRLAMSVLSCLAGENFSCVPSKDATARPGLARPSQVAESPLLMHPSIGS